MRSILPDERGLSHGRPESPSREGAKAALNGGDYGDRGLCLSEKDSWEQHSRAGLEVDIWDEVAVQLALNGGDYGDRRLA